MQHTAKTINAPLLSMLSLRSRWNAGPTKGNVEIQYVPGAPTIFKGDYIDATGELQPGLRKLFGVDLDKEQYRRASDEKIGFVDGYMFLDNFGGAGKQNLLAFVFHHALNEGSPNYKRTKDLNGQLLFKPFLPEKKAKFSMDKFDLESAAVTLLSNVRDGKGNFIQMKLNALCGIFGVGGGLGPDENNQKFELLIPKMKSNPASFLETYKESTEEHRMSIKMAQQFGLLAFTSKDAKLTLPTESRSIYEFTEEKAAEREDAVINYFLGGEKGRQDYSILCGEVENKKILALK